MIPFGPDAEVDPGSFDALALVDRATEQLRRMRVAGVVSSSDYPGCLVASVIADRIGLPGPAPQAVLRAAHKYLARQILSEAVPEATPQFQLIDPRRMDTVLGALRFPIFVKPVKSWFSQLAQRIDSAEELNAYVGTPAVRSHLEHFVRPLNQLLAGYPEFTLDAAYLLGEEVLVGPQVTVEGYVFDGRTTVLTIVDSEMYPGTSSFARFVVPSVVTKEQADAMTLLSDRAVRALGITHGLFNIEFISDPETRRFSIVEINPRMCGQFADMTEHVTGVNTYEILFDLAAGIRPPPIRPAGEAAAASYPLRRFGDGKVRSIPTASRIARIQRSFPASLIAMYYQAGDQLSERSKHFDGASYRYACVNLVASRRADLDPLMRQVEQLLDIQITAP